MTHASVKVIPYERPPYVPPPPAEKPVPVDWAGFVKVWRDRETRAHPPERITSPTKLEEHDKATPLELTEGPRGLARGVEVGVLCHQILEQLDFKAPKAPERTDPEAAELLEKFFKSAAFKELAKAEILARELPFLLPRDGRVVQGVIDVVYRSGGKLVVADYKTDTILKPESYGLIRELYTEAVRRALGEDPVFKLIYLRHGKSVTV